MSKLYNKLLILFLIFILYILLFLAFDVNDRFGVRRKILYNLSDINSISYDGTKTAYSPYTNFDYMKYMEKTGETDYTIILGDSRIQRLNCERMYKETGEKYVNFSFAGCTLDEEVFELKYLIPRIKMKKLIFLIDVYNLNKYRNLNRLEKIPNMTILNYIFDYWNNRRMLEEFIDYIKHFCIQQNTMDEKILNDMENKRFVDHVTNVVRDSFPYAVNQSALDELDILVEELKKRGTEIIFYIPPVYKIFYDEMLIKNNLMVESNLLKQKLLDKATVYDMQYISEFTVENKYWEDNFHLYEDGMRIIENTIIGKDGRYVKINNRN